jgi:transcription elongation factor Elf1
MSIEIINGKFLKDGKEIKPTFGDTEQIRVLKEAERKANERKVHAKLIEKEVTTYYACIEFVCPICKEKNSVDLFEDEPQEWNIDKNDVDGLYRSCKKCDLHFTINADKTDKKSMKIYLTYDPSIEN